ncbi:MAG: hypothetical protein ACK4J0_02815 [Candidatus Anstonellaceae archaeon]
MGSIKFLLILFLIFGFSFSVILANEIKTTTISDFLITKNCIIELEESINPNTGAKLTKVSSLFTIELTNSKSAKQKVVLEQDISYLPSSIKPTFNINPTSTPGNYVSWDLGAMDIGQTQTIKILVPSKVSCDRFFKDNSLFLNYKKPAAVLQASPSVQKGDFIEVSLKDPQNKPLKNVLVVVIKPSQLKFEYLTNQDGKIRILADESGVYSYQVYDYEVNTFTTKVLESIPQQNLTQNEKSQTKEEFDFSIIFNFVGIIFVLGAILGVYLLFRHLNQNKEEEVHVPEAYAENLEGSLAKKFREEYEEKIKGKGADYNEEEKKQEEEDFDKKTTELISKRKVHSLFQQEKEPDKLEQILKAEEFQSEELSKESEEKIEKEELDEDEIDEEAIKKTIAELEQLREELKQKQKSMQSLPPESAIVYEQKELEKPSKKTSSKKQKEKERESKKTALKKESTKPFKGDEDDIETQIEQLLLETETETKKGKSKEEKKPKKRAKRKT